MMKRFPMAIGLAKSCVLAAVFGVLAASMARADQFVVQNLTPKAIVEVHVSHPRQEVWGPDRLGDQLIWPNEQWTVYVPGGLPCTQDIKAVMSDGEEVIDYQVNICDGRWTLFPQY